MSGARTCLLGIDLGAGSLKASVVTADGTLLGEAAHPVDTQSPKPGWSEQDPDDWYRALCRAVPAALVRSRCEAKAVAGVGVSAGAHIGVLLDAADAVIRPAILWNDQRSAAEADELHRRAGQQIVETTLNRVNPTWTLPQLLWLLRHEPEAVARTKRLFLAKDYLRFRLSGAWVSDFSDAVGALMADSTRRTWSDDICRLIDWPTATLPPLAEPSQVVGAVTRRAAEDTGLVEGIPVVTGSNDTTVEAFGAGAVASGQGLIKLATAGVLYLVTDAPRALPPISCYPHVLPGLSYWATGMNACASAHRWLRDQMFAPPSDAAAAGDDLFATMDRLAAEAPVGAEGMIFHPFLQGERAPYWDPKLRAHFLGATLRHGRPHFVRALYEGIAFALRDLLEVAERQGLAFAELRVIGGGARSALWRQIISDVLGREILLPAQGDASFGAALLAGVGVGLFAGEREAADCAEGIRDRRTPSPEAHAFLSELFAIYKESQARLAELDHRLQDLCAGGPTDARR